MSSPPFSGDLSAPTSPGDTHTCSKAPTQKVVNKKQALRVHSSTKEHNELFHSALLHVLHQSTPDRQHRVDLIEACTPQNSLPAAAVMKKGGCAERWGLQNYDLSQTGLGKPFVI